MYEKQLRQALCIDKNYNFNYLKDLDHNHRFDNDHIEFPSFFELLLHAEKDGLDEKPYIVQETKSSLDIFSLPSAKGAWKNISSISFQIEIAKAFLNQAIDKDKDAIDDRINELTNSLDNRLRSILEALLLTYSAKIDPNEELLPKSIKHAFVDFVKRTIDENKYDENILSILKFYGQVFRYFLYIGNLEKYEEENHNTEVFSYLAYLIATGFYKRRGVEQGLPFAKKGLNIRQYHDKAISYHYLGLLAMETGDLQLSYDTYYSWLKQKYFGEINKCASETYFFDPEEKTWRSNTALGKLRTSIMYGNLAYVCGRISDTYELSSKQGKHFYQLSIDYRSKAMNLNDGKAWYIYTLGKALTQDMASDFDDPESSHFQNLDKAIGLLKKASKQLIEPKYSESHLNSYRLICLALMEKMLWKAYKSKNADLLDNKDILNYYGQLKAAADAYSNIAIESSPSDDEGLIDQLNLRAELMPLLSLFKTLEDKTKDTKMLDNKIHIFLILIRITVIIMKRYLRRRDYISTEFKTYEADDKTKRAPARPVMYYTTLNNFTHIFDELYFDTAGRPAKIDKDGSQSNTTNCLTVMNAKYMNDPEEGIVLLRELKRPSWIRHLFSNNTNEYFAKLVYDNKLVFLKSFTEEFDKLTMWNRYASDYDSEGRNTNGCCAFVAPECMEKFIKTSISGNELSSNNWDDYHLYRVVYLSNKGSILKEKNPNLDPNVKKLYMYLKKTIWHLDTYVGKYVKTHRKKKAVILDTVEKQLLESLKMITFLFKYDDYSDEQESRICLFRTSRNQGDVRVIPAKIPLLAINPNCQVLIKRLVFAPNAKNIEKWTPYFQHQLNNMWEKHYLSTATSTSKPEDLYSIEHSSIKYLN